MIGSSIDGFDHKTIEGIHSRGWLFTPNIDPQKLNKLHVSCHPVHRSWAKLNGEIKQIICETNA